MRTRKLPFIVLFILILRSSVKSLQNVLNEFTLAQDKAFTITAGAFTKARKKLKHTAYIELNEDITKIYYRDDDIKRYHGYRLLAFDGSKIILPYSKEIVSEFGETPIKNGKETLLGSYASAMFQSCYDVLNHIAVSSTLARGDAYEADLASEMLPSLEANDLLIFDRGYASYIFMATLFAAKKQFIIRCPKSSFTAVKNMFDEDAPADFTVWVDVPKKHKALAQQLDLPKRIKLRLIRVVLTTGEVEVLVTSLFDEAAFSVDDFYYLYGLRWGVETFFSKIKGRLGLENFTGKSVETIRQDFWATIFLSNLETIITEDVEHEKNETQDDKKSVKLNKAVCFNVIKNAAFDLLSNENDTSEQLKKLTKLFVMGAIPERKGRKVKRDKISANRSLNFQKRFRKHVF